MVKSATHIGDCNAVLRKLKPESVDLIYLDPPFYTQRNHALVTRDGSSSFSFSDIWDDGHSYGDFLHERMTAARRVLKASGSLFFHCDKSAAHIVRIVLDSVFGQEMFQSEIIWSFKRWSNSKKGLLPAHQTIFFYSKSKQFKFNAIYQEYSASTNVEQIMQKRTRDDRNKSVYARDTKGAVVSNGAKRGVPLSDVWEIPFLNPKAKERVGFPTQKPVLLMNRIISLVTTEGDVVLDPFCGSGTTLVAAKLLNRNSIGIDISPDAIALTESRLAKPVVSDSPLLRKGRESYRQHPNEAAAHLVGIEYTPIQRNKGIDALLKDELDGLPVFVRVQRESETLAQTVEALRKASKKKGACRLFVVATSEDLLSAHSYVDVGVIPSAAMTIRKLFDQPKKRSTPKKRSRKVKLAAAA